MLTAAEIIKEVEAGRIEIDPFDPRPTRAGGQMGPNSYDLRLGSKIRKVGLGIDDTGKACDYWLDLKRPYDCSERVYGPGEKIAIMPRERYLACTKERTYTPFHVPKIDGRSTLGRYFVMVHVTAGFGDIGFNGSWTLEIFNLGPSPVWLYEGMRIAQIYFDRADGEIDPRYTYAGGYNINRAEPVSARPGNI